MEFDCEMFETVKLRILISKQINIYKILIETCYTDFSKHNLNLII